MSKKVLMTDGGATVEQREDLIAAIEKFLEKGGSAEFKIVAAMDVNLEIDDVLIGSSVRVGKYEFEFTRDRFVPLGEYYIMQAEQGSKNPLREVWAKWPGNEPIEDILAALTGSEGSDE